MSNNINNFQRYQPYFNLIELISFVCLKVKSTGLPNKIFNNLYRSKQHSYLIFLTENVDLNLPTEYERYIIAVQNIETKKSDHKISYLLMCCFNNKRLFNVINSLLIFKHLLKYQPNITELRKKIILFRCKNEKTGK